MALTPASSQTPSAQQLDYAQITANATFTATSDATADAIVTGSAVTYDGATAVVVEFYCQRVDLNSIASGAQCVINLYQDGSDIGRLAQFGPGMGGTSAGAGMAMSGRRRLTPSAGSHTYSIRAWATAASTGTLQAGAGGAATSVPAFLRITRAA